MTIVTANFCHADTYTQTLGASIPRNTTTVLTFTATPPAASDASLTLVALSGELDDGFNKRLESLTVDGDTYTTPPATGAILPGYILPTTQTQDFYLGVGGGLPDSITIPLANLNGYVADGEVDVSVFFPNFISGGDFEIILSYTSAIPEPSSFALLTMGSLAIVVRRRTHVNR